MTTVPASYDSLLTQASDTSETYLRRAVRAIDAQFGEGFARSNPDLVGKMIIASAMDFAAASFGKVIGELNDTIENKNFTE